MMRKWFYGLSVVKLGCLGGHWGWESRESGQGWTWRPRQGEHLRRRHLDGDDNDSTHLSSGSLYWSSASRSRIIRRSSWSSGAVIQGDSRSGGR